MGCGRLRGTERIGVTGLTLLALLGSAGCAARITRPTAPTNHSWSRIVDLEPGSLVRVADFDGRYVTGHLSNVVGAVVTLDDSGSAREFRQKDVACLSVLTRGMTEGARRGLIVGALAGVVVGVLTTRSNRLPWAAMLAGGWGSIGALVGASIGGVNEELVLFDKRSGASPRTDHTNRAANRPLQLTGCAGS